MEERKEEEEREKKNKKQEEQIPERGKNCVVVEWRWCALFKDASWPYNHVREREDTHSRVLLACMLRGSFHV